MYGATIDGLTPDNLINFGRTTGGTATPALALFRAPTVTPRKIGYVVFGEEYDTGSVLTIPSVAVWVAPPATAELGTLPPLEAITIPSVATWSAPPAEAYIIISSPDALLRRSMTTLGLFFLRGGVVPTGSNLETELERMYSLGLYIGDLEAGVVHALNVKMGGAWKEAVMFTRVAGVWKATTINVKAGGGWKS